jgi:predicted Zn-dependent protease
MKPKEIRQIEEALGLTIPSEYALLLLDHPEVSQNFELLDSAENIINENLEVRQKGFWGVQWEATYLVIGIDGCGNNYFIATNPFDRRVYLADHEDVFDPSNLSRLTSYATLGEYVQELARIDEEIEEEGIARNDRKRFFIDLLLSIFRLNQIKIWLFVVAIALAYLFLPRGTDLGNSGHDIGGQKIVIIPSGEIPIPFLKHLEENLEKMHGTDVLITTNMGLDENWIIQETDQYNAGYLSKRGEEIFKALGRQDAYCIILTNKDINYPDTGLRFLLSVQYPSNSVVSLARMNPLNMGLTLNILSVPYAFNQTSVRALKMINKELGKGFYGYPISNSRGSVMYGPIMSVQDLDSIGIWYE